MTIVVTDLPHLKDVKDSTKGCCLRNNTIYHQRKLNIKLKLKLNLKMWVTEKKLGLHESNQSQGVQDCVFLLWPHPPGSIICSLSSSASPTPDTVSQCMICISLSILTDRPVCKDLLYVSPVCHGSFVFTKAQRNTTRHGTALVKQQTYSGGVNLISVIVTFWRI